jgi:hypothetical protein
MNTHLGLFLEQTKQLHLFLSLTLFLIIIFIVAPINLGFGKPLGQIFILILLSYILYANFIETHKFALQQNNKENDEAQSEDIKNNTRASYVLCGFILLLILYFSYSIVF